MALTLTYGSLGLCPRSHSFLSVFVNSIYGISTLVCLLLCCFLVAGLTAHTLKDCFLQSLVLYQDPWLSQALPGEVEPIGRLPWASITWTAQPTASASAAFGGDLSRVKSITC